MMIDVLITICRSCKSVEEDMWQYAVGKGLKIITATGQVRRCKNCW